MNLSEMTLTNENYRFVYQTTPNMQLVLMNLLPGESIPKERHQGTQFIRVEKGTLEGMISGERVTLEEDEFIIVSPMQIHEFWTSEGCSLYTIYSPPEHDPTKIRNRM